MQPSVTNVDVIFAGAGIAGCRLAAGPVSAGLRVTVLEKAAPGRFRPVAGACH
ncbi:MAG: FAD-binding protein [Deltaproteobacteria bacterium]|nr:FAD-binding protein [Candidatus Anaeroferrophillacea bacterium]